MKLSNPVIAAIDIGTNSFHLLVAQIDKKNKLNVFYKVKQIMRLTSELGHKAKIISKQEFKEEEQRLIKEQNPYDNVLKEVMENSKAVVVLASTRSGKTALCYQLLMNSPTKKYFFKHPRPELIKDLGIENCYDFADLAKLEDATVYVDECGIELPLKDRKANQKLRLLLTLAGQRNIKLIFSTSDTRYFTRGEEYFIDTWIVKDIPYEMIKRGSPVKRAIEDYEKIDVEAFSLQVHEFLIRNRKLKHLNGKHTFELPKFWNEKYSKPYSDKLFDSPADIPAYTSESSSEVRK